MLNNQASLNDQFTRHALWSRVAWGIRLNRKFDRLGFFNDFSAFYIGVFALVAILFDKFLFKEQVQPTTWIGLALILTGGLIIQFGSNR
jgi:drug/metabolite transporter superfamily protein YnfA